MSCGAALHDSGSIHVFARSLDGDPFLEMVLAANIWWFHKQEIARVLESDPNSYVTIEIRLAREEHWVHSSRCEIDSLNAAAERLFHETR